MRIRQRLEILRDWFATPACALCGESTTRERRLCGGCERALPELGAHCAVCATPLPGAGIDRLICGRCQQRPPRYAYAHALFRYAAPIDRLIQGAKYHGRLDWLDMLGRRLSDHARVKANAIDAIVPVPLHRSRLRERGYNQSLELARPLSKRLGIGLNLDIERVRATRPQKAMSGAERRRNVRNAFAATKEFSGLRIAVVDDVMTSGATVDAVARCLRKAGAASVAVWVVARA
jgi:ComF family protein